MEGWLDVAISVIPPILSMAIFSGSCSSDLIVIDKGVKHAVCNLWERFGACFKWLFFGVFE